MLCIKFGGHLQNFLVCRCDTACLKLKVLLYRFKSAYILSTFNIVMPHKLNHSVACFFKVLNQRNLYGNLLLQDAQDHSLLRQTRKGARKLRSKIGERTNSIFTRDKVDFCENGRCIKVRR